MWLIYIFFKETETKWVDLHHLPLFPPKGCEFLHAFAVKSMERKCQRIPVEIYRERERVRERGRERDPVDARSIELESDSICVRVVGHLSVFSA